MISLATATLNHQSNFSVEEIDSSNKEIIIKIRSAVRDWRNYAKSQKEIIEAFAALGEWIDSFAVKSYAASFRVNWSCAERLRRPANFATAFRTIVCLDTNNELLGYACIDKIPKYLALHPENGVSMDNLLLSNRHPREFIYLRFLSSDPHRCLNSATDNPIKGVGLALLNHVREICKQENKAGILVEPLPEALLFFEKQQFTRLPYQPPEARYAHLYPDGQVPERNQMIWQIRK